MGISSSLLTLPLYGVSGVYDRIGIIPEHGLHGAVPEENIDLFTGNLTLRFQDIRLPGPNGFDTVVWRVYNSKILPTISFILKTVRSGPSACPKPLSSRESANRSVW